MTQNTKDDFLVGDVWVSNDTGQRYVVQSVETDEVDTDAQVFVVMMQEHGERGVLGYPPNVRRHYTLECVAKEAA